MTKRILSACIMLLVLASGVFAAEFKAGDVIVVLKPDSSRVSVSSLNVAGIDANKLASIAEGSGAHVLNSYKKLSAKANKIFATIHSDTKSPQELAQELLQNPEVLAASPNYIARISDLIPNETIYKDQWALEYIKAPEAWEYTTGSSNVYVAVIDTGVDWTNPDLADNVAVNLAKSFVSSTSSALDDHGHGTHVAGIIGAKGDNSSGVVGVNWDVKIIPIKAMNSDGSGYIEDIMEGIDYIIDLVGQGYNVVAANLSLEFYAEEAPTYANLTATPLWQSFKALDDLNSTAIVVAAGNYQAVVGETTTKTMYDGNGNLIYKPGMYVYPASFRGLDNLISVSALNTDGNIADFSNTNATISAPGVEIYSTYLQSDKNHTGADGVSIIIMAGTSMAAPYVSGGIALLAASKPDQTAFQYKCALRGIKGDDDLLPESNTAIIKKLDLAYAMNFQENNTIDKDGTQWDEEFNGGSSNNNNNNNGNNNNNNNNENDENDNYNYNNRGHRSSSGCNGGVMAFAGLIVLCPLFIRRKD